MSRSAKGPGDFFRTIVAPMVVLIFLFFIPVFLVWQLIKLIVLVILIIRDALNSSAKLPYLLFLPGHILLRWRYFFTTEWGAGKNTVQSSRQMKDQIIFAALLSIPGYALICLAIALIVTDNQYISLIVNVAYFYKGMYSELFFGS